MRQILDGVAVSPNVAEPLGAQAKRLPFSAQHAVIVATQASEAPELATSQAFSGTIAGLLAQQQALLQIRLGHAW